MQERITSILWSSIKDIYSAILSHPFITGLVDGTLELEKFKYYIAQDFHYLKGFARALAVLSAKSDDDNVMNFFAGQVQTAMNVEAELHRYYIKELNIDVEKIEPSPTNLAYVNFLLSTVYSRPYHEALGAILPCYWIYLEVGKELQKRGSRSEVYQKWINTYGGEEYEKSVNEVLRIVDSLKLTKEELDEMKRMFRQASIYEYMFWDSAYRMERFPFSINI
ncbi:MAG: thiaminase II [Sulfolobaceae archaeon]|nr:thiaminase II [Sulfolobaceae archaeon]